MTTTETTVTMTAVDEADIVFGRLDILRSTGMAGWRGVDRAMRTAKLLAGTWEPMTCAALWRVAAKNAQEVFPGEKPRTEAEAQAYVARVAALPDEVAASAAHDETTAREIADRICTECAAELEAARETATCRFAVRLGWTWAHVAVIRAGWMRGRRTLDDAQDLRAAAHQLVAAGFVSYQVQDGRIYVYITDAGAHAWYLWLYVLDKGGYITFGPERAPAVVS